MSESAYGTPEKGFLWKPQADHTGNLVILLPSKYRQSQVTLKAPSGEVIEQGKSSGYANGDREHFRFGQAGGRYPAGSIVEVTTSDGNVMRYKIQNTAGRVDPGGDGGSGMSSGGSIDAMSMLSNVGMGSFPKPASSVGSIAATAASNAEIFKSPLSVVETIRNVSNIIVGASRNFNMVTSSLAELDTSLNSISDSIIGGRLGKDEEESTDKISDILNLSIKL